MYASLLNEFRNGICICLLEFLTRRSGQFSKYTYTFLGMGILKILVTTDDGGSRKSQLR
jgi:hypothetical protein